MPNTSNPINHQMLEHRPTIQVRFDLILKIACPRFGTQPMSSDAISWPHHAEVPVIFASTWCSDSGQILNQGTMNHLPGRFTAADVMSNRTLDWNDLNA
jgi:hypothetical protein